MVDFLLKCECEYDVSERYSKQLRVCQMYPLMYPDNFARIFNYIVTKLFCEGVYYIPYRVRNLFTDEILTSTDDYKNRNQLVFLAECAVNSPHMDYMDSVAMEEAKINPIIYTSMQSLQWHIQTTRANSEVEADVMARWICSALTSIDIISPASITSILEVSPHLRAAMNDMNNVTTPNSHVLFSENPDTERAHVNPSTIRQVNEGLDYLKAIVHYELADFQSTLVQFMQGNLWQNNCITHAPLSCLLHYNKTVKSTLRPPASTPFIKITEFQFPFDDIAENTHQITKSRDVYTPYSTSITSKIRQLDQVSKFDAYIAQSNYWEQLDDEYKNYYKLFSDMFTIDPHTVNVEGCVLDTQDQFKSIMLSLKHNPVNMFRHAYWDAPEFLTYNKEQNRYNEDISIGDGPKREYLFNMLLEIKRAELFVATGSGRYVISASVTDTSSYFASADTNPYTIHNAYYLVGNLLRFCILSGIQMPFHLSNAILGALLQEDLTLDTLRSDAAYYYVLDNIHELSIASLNYAAMNEDSLETCSDALHLTNTFACNRLIQLHAGFNCNRKHELGQWQWQRQVRAAVDESGAFSLPILDFMTRANSFTSLGLKTFVNSHLTIEFHDDDEVNLRMIGRLKHLLLAMFTDSNYECFPHSLVGVSASAWVAMEGDERRMHHVAFLEKLFQLWSGVNALLDTARYTISILRGQDIHAISFHTCTLSVDLPEKYVEPIMLAETSETQQLTYIYNMFVTLTTVPIDNQLAGGGCARPKKYRARL